MALSKEPGKLISSLLKKIGSLTTKRPEGGLEYVFLKNCSLANCSFVRNFFWWNSSWFQKDWSNKSIFSSSAICRAETLWIVLWTFVSPDTMWPKEVFWAIGSSISPLIGSPWIIWE